MMPAQRPPSLIHRLRIEVHAAWLAARDQRTPWLARLIGLGVTAYALSPIDLIPDFIPVLGLLDDAVIVPLGLWIFKKMLPAGVFEDARAKAELASEQPGSSWGVVIVVLLWLGCAYLLFRLLAWGAQ